MWLYQLPRIFLNLIHQRFYEIFFFFFFFFGAGWDKNAKGIQAYRNYSKERKYGARPLKRAIQTLIEDPITDMLLSETEIENKQIKI